MDSKVVLLKKGKYQQLKHHALHTRLDRKQASFSLQLGLQVLAKLVFVLVAALTSIHHRPLRVELDVLTHVFHTDVSLLRRQMSCRENNVSLQAVVVHEAVFGDALDLFWITAVSRAFDTVGFGYLR